MEARLAGGGDCRLLAVLQVRAGKPRPLKPERARYNGSYRVTAAFLAYLTEKYDKDIVRKLNRMMREGEYLGQLSP